MSLRRRGVLSTKCTICGSLQKPNKKRSFFPFPRDLERCRAWIKALGLLKLLVMPLSELYEQVVCDTHFPRGCLNKTGTRLHKVALPTLSRCPPLSDSITASWPCTFDREVNPKRRYVTSDHAVQINQPEIIATSDEDNDINYDQPLMTCIQTLKNKDKHVKKPAGVLNTISVPLLTYTSSLERGTIFAANEPKSIDLAKLPQLNAQYKSPAKEFCLQNKEAYANTNYTTINIKENVKYLSTTENKMKKKNNVSRYASSPIPRAVLSGKDARSMRIKMVAAKTSEAAELPQSNTEPSSQHLKGIQYFRSSIHSLLNESLFDKKGSVLQYKATNKNDTAKLSYSAHQLLQKNETIDPFTPAVKSENLEHREIIIPLSPKLSEKLVSDIIKKPAGVLNTISVPLLTYTSSLEHGTIFAANEPKSIDLAKLPQLNAQYKSPAKELFLQNKEAYKNTNYTTINIRKNVKYLSTAENKMKKNIYVSRYASSPIPRAVLSGKNARSMRIKMIATKTSEAAELPQSNTEPSSQHLKGIQYFRSSIHSLLNESLFDKKGSVLQYKATNKNDTAELSYSAHQLLQKNETIDPFTPAVKSENLENREIIIPLSPKLNEKLVSENIDSTTNSITEDPNDTEMEDSTITELGDMASFTPGDLPLRPRGSSYEQHAVNEFSESTNAHVEEGTQELSSPLFKPTDTTSISKGKINYYRIPTNVPLLNCMQILEYY